MKTNDRVLFKIMLYKSMGCILLLLVVLLQAIHVLNTMMLYAGIGLAIVLIVMNVRYGSKVYQDYINKDYKDHEGVLKRIVFSTVDSFSPYITTDEFFLEGEDDPYYLPKGLLRPIEKGQKFTFIYAKRSKIILQIRKTIA